MRIFISMDNEWRKKKEEDKLSTLSVSQVNITVHSTKIIEIMPKDSSIQIRVFQEESQEKNQPQNSDAKAVDKDEKKQAKEQQVGDEKSKSQKRG